MDGIPGELIGILRRAFAESEVFEDNRTLRNFFKERESLKPWWTSVPEGHNPQSRADGLIGFLSNKSRARGRTTEWYDGLPLLVIFIGELILYYKEKCESGRGEPPEEVMSLFIAVAPSVPGLPLTGTH